MLVTSETLNAKFQRYGQDKTLVAFLPYNLVVNR